MLHCDCCYASISFCAQVSQPLRLPLVLLLALSTLSVGAVGVGAEVALLWRHATIAASTALLNCRPLGPVLATATMKTACALSLGLGCTPMCLTPPVPPSSTALGLRGHVVPGPCSMRRLVCATGLRIRGVWLSRPRNGRLAQSLFTLVTSLVFWTLHWRLETAIKGLLGAPGRDAETHLLSVVRVFDALQP
jgi:hypothetical protein